VLLAVGTTVLKPRASLSKQCRRFEIRTCTTTTCRKSSCFCATLVEGAASHCQILQRFMDLPPCLAIVLEIVFVPERHTSFLPASPKSTTCGSLGMPSCGGAASIAAFSVDLNNSSVSTHGIVVSFSAWANTSCRREQLSDQRSAVVRALLLD